LLTEGGELDLPGFSEQVHYELELVLFLGKGGKDISTEEAMDCIGGVGLGVDFTARDIQLQAKEKGSPWTIAKGFDGAAYVSRLVPAEILQERESLSMFLWRDQQLRQKGELGNMIYGPEEIVAYLSRYMSLYPGDIIFTGTPAGVGSVYSGNKISLQLKRDGRIVLDSQFSIA
jgi:2-keto-4-pentenoate hydratase/2-oxohepta-3-ene-1,7-dioic acid hydratase in catechol pathway